MSEYVLHKVIPIEDGAGDSRISDKGIYISILNATHRPPHLVLVVKGLAYSISVSGFKSENKLQDLIRLIFAKKIKTLFIELVPVYFKEDDNLLINKFVSICHSVELGKVTCIYPIKEFCKLAYNVDISKVDFIFDLLPILEKNSLIKNRLALNMNDDVINGTFNLRSYNLSTVLKRIEKTRFKQISK